MNDTSITNRERFRDLQAAFNRMIGRSQMSRRLGHYSRAYRQVLGAERIYRMIIKQPNI